MLSVSTTRLLKAILPAACLWTSLREVEGFRYEETLRELTELYPADEDEVMDDDQGLNRNIPQSIRDMVGSRSAIEALGSMIW
jgi:DNA mismatch repair protein MSH6